MPFTGCPTTFLGCDFPFFIVRCSVITFTFALPYTIDSITLLALHVDFPADYYVCATTFIRSYTPAPPFPAALRCCYPACTTAADHRFAWIAPTHYHRSHFGWLPYCPCFLYTSSSHASTILPQFSRSCTHGYAVYHDGLPRMRSHCRHLPRSVPPATGSGSVLAPHTRHAHAPHSHTTRTGGRLLPPLPVHVLLYSRRYCSLFVDFWLYVLTVCGEKHVWVVVRSAWRWSSRFSGIGVVDAYHLIAIFSCPGWLFCCSAGLPLRSVVVFLPV